ncbi:hypothetical protein [Thalassobacter stenotrophicus]|jgi:hypothetical protein|uniref:Uncharacterized protein n=2 Tax=Thalassobacter stenotrophicus TaxID=266809 RepID=A0A0P1EUT1_9RHOB|nr:hypothetical protein [Thalassobacter stenotrophicus]CUH58735.1 hypothetical protein THS5294_00013 [Thalassobacter stenotrophicus]SHJ40149.1 hypothetical protein SAMN02744035_03622 [Thalassobacter stenotrophicus DSM 16310]
MLLYIDEEADQGRRVLLAAGLSGHFEDDEVETLLPEPDLESMIERIIESRCEVLVTDYRLSEYKADVQYTGLELIQEMQRHFEGFPCFLTTNYVPHALGKLHDVNLIFPKDDYLSDDSGAGDKNKSALPFFLRVRTKIDEYRADQRRLEEDFQALYERSLNEVLNADELQNLLNLDDQLERSIGGRVAALPRLLKEDALGPFNDLLRRAEDLAAVIENELEQNEAED